MRRLGEGGNLCCIDCVLKTPDERDPDTQRVPPNLALSPSDRDIDSDVYGLVFADYCVRTKEALVIAYSRNANLCYVFSEPPVNLV